MADEWSAAAMIQEIEFAPDSPLEGDGFEPSALCSESSVSAAFRASVAANLHPYSAQICTPASTESCNLKLFTWGWLRPSRVNSPATPSKPLCASKSTQGR